MILFMVEYGNCHVITYALNREGAKRNAFKWMGVGPYHEPSYGRPDEYVVTPLTEEGAIVSTWM